MTPTGFAPDSSQTLGERLGRVSWGRYSVLLIWAILMVAFWLAQDTFLTEGGIRFALGNRVTIGLMTLGLLVPFAAGHFDLSVGAMVGFAGMFTVWIEETNQLGAGNAWLVVIVVLVCCAGFGFVNGFLVVKLRINSFIATLGMASVIQAITFYISGNRRIDGVFSDQFRDVVRAEWLGQFRSFWYLLIVAAILWYVLEYTPIGRYLFATGGNPEAARLAGVRTSRYVWSSLVVSAVLAGLGGIIFVLRQDSATPDTGPPLLFAAFAAVFLGSTQIKNRPNVLGTLISIYMLAFLSRGLTIQFTGVWVDPLADGLVLIVAVAAASVDWSNVRGWFRGSGPVASDEPVHRPPQHAPQEE